VPGSAADCVVVLEQPVNNAANDKANAPNNNWLFAAFFGVFIERSTEKLGIVFLWFMFVSIPAKIGKARDHLSDGGKQSGSKGGRA